MTTALLQKELIHATPAPGRISRAAAALGLHPFGNMARHYRRLFGKLPGETLNRRPPRRLRRRDVEMRRFGQPGCRSPRTLRTEQTPSSPGSSQTPERFEEI